MDLWTFLSIAVIAGSATAIFGTKYANRSAESAKALDELHQRIDALTERVITLERINTDSGYHIKREIDGLS